MEVGNNRVCLSILAPEGRAPFVARVSTDGWSTHQDIIATAVPKLGIYHVDVATTPGANAPVQFTFYWTNGNRWEGANFAVALDHAVPLHRSGAPAAPRVAGGKQ